MYGRRIEIKRWGSVSERRVITRRDSAKINPSFLTLIEWGTEISRPMLIEKSQRREHWAKLEFCASSCRYYYPPLQFTALKYTARQMSSRKFEVGIIGYGLSAKIFHLPFITCIPQLHLYAIVQRTPKPDNDAEKDFPGLKVYRSVDELLSDEKVDVVVVTAVPDQHFTLTQRALLAGKHGEHPCPIQSYHNLSVDSRG